MRTYDFDEAREIRPFGEDGPAYMAVPRIAAENREELAWCFQSDVRAEIPEDERSDDLLYVRLEQWRQMMG